jgi:hypothetical protein
MAIIKGVMVFVLFVVLSEKTLLHNLISNIYNGSTNFLSIEKFINDIVNIARVVNESFSFAFGVGVVFAEIVLMLGIAFAFCYGVKAVCVKFIRTERTSLNQRVHSVVYATNDIYLKTSKFIC